MVIDVGINRVDAGGGKTKMVGDVDYDAAAEGRGRDHAGAGRRRRHDHRLPDAQHADRGRAAERALPLPASRLFLMIADVIAGNVRRSSQARPSKSISWHGLRCALASTSSGWPELPS